MTDRAAMKMALEALEALKKDVKGKGAPEHWDAYYAKQGDALDALSQALAQPEQEPVAWEKSYDIVCALLRQAHDILATTQYPIKREWVGLTDDEIDWIFGLAYADDMELLRTIEAKLKDKNG